MGRQSKVFRPISLEDNQRLHWIKCSTPLALRRASAIARVIRAIVVEGSSCVRRGVHGALTAPGRKQPRPSR